MEAQAFEADAPAAPSKRARAGESRVLRELAETIAPLTGEPFFGAAVRYLASALGIQAVFVAECVDYPTTRVRILAEWDRGRFTAPREFALAGTPCNATIGEGRVTCLPDRLLDRFPQYGERERTSYLGAPVVDPTDERVIGHLALWDSKPLSLPAIAAQPLFRIFVSRIGAELRRKRADDTLSVIAGTLAPTTGDAFYRALLECLAKSLQVRKAFVAACVDDPPTRMRVLACWDRSGFRDGFEYDLAGLPCERAIRERREVFYARGVGDDYPCERENGIDAYLGLPICDPASGQVLGHLALLDDKPMPPTLPESPLVRIFLSRVAAELRRKRADDVMWMVAEATAPLAGPEFFRTLVHSLAKVLSFREVFITECVDPRATRVRMLSHWVGEGYASNDEYEIDGTPCAVTIRERRTTFVGERLEELFPHCAGDQAYLGLPVFDASGERIIGHIAFYDTRPRHASIVDNPVFRILASRAGAELLRKRAEDDLRANEAKYRLIVENQSDLVVQLDRSWRYRFVSPSFCECFGREEVELLGARFAPEVHPLDLEPFEAARADAAAPPYRGQTEARMLTAAGWRWLAWVFSAVLDAQGEVTEIIASGRDVTERQRAEEQAREHLASLAHVTRLSSMGEMASAIAHEVNQPLTAVVTYTQACIRLLRAGDAEPGEIAQWMERAGAQAARAAEIIRHLRTFVRKDEAQLVPLDVNFAVEEVVRLTRPDARQSAVDILVAPGMDLPAILADSIQIQQVLVNLVRNAVDAIASVGAGRREVRIATRLGVDGWVEVEVEDTGPGFDEATAARLFEPFFSTKPDGMGIGLSISRSIVDAHGGRIAAARAPAGGARFTLALPPAVLHPEH